MTKFIIFKRHVFKSNDGPEINYMYAYPNKLVYCTTIDMHNLLVSHYNRVNLY